MGNRNKQMKEKLKWDIAEIKNTYSTMNMVSLCHKKSSFEGSKLQDHEFCFIVRPASCTRKLSLMGLKYSTQIKDMRFAADNVVLVKLKTGKCLLFSHNGIMMHKYTDDQSAWDILNNSTLEIVAE